MNLGISKRLKEFLGLGNLDQIAEAETPPPSQAELGERYVEVTISNGDLDSAVLDMNLLEEVARKFGARKIITNEMVLAVSRDERNKIERPPGYYDLNYVTFRVRKKHVETFEEEARIAANGGQLILEFPQDQFAPTNQ